jgi:hypothetical protein
VKIKDFKVDVQRVGKEPKAGAGHEHFAVARPAMVPRGDSSSAPTPSST